MQGRSGQDLNQGRLDEKLKEPVDKNFKFDDNG